MRHTFILKYFIIISFFITGNLKAQTIEVEVNENVELMSILSRMAGFPEYSMDLGGQYIMDMDTFDGDDTKRNARSLRLTGINYRADKTLIKRANRHCKLERAGESRLHHTPYSKEERLKLAQQYLEEHSAMRVADYMELTGLSRTKATLELKEFRQDASSGISFVGRGSAKVYVKRV